MWMLGAIRFQGSELLWDVFNAHWQSAGCSPVYKHNMDFNNNISDNATGCLVKAKVKAKFPLRNKQHIQQISKKV